MWHVLRGTSFEGILTRIHASFGENQGKLRTAKTTSPTGNLIWHFPSTSFERRIAPPLVGPLVDKSNITHKLGGPPLCFYRDGPASSHVQLVL